MHESDEFLPEGVPSELWQELVHRTSNASIVAVLSGAGISAASGIPTFRGKDGLWKQYRAEELATPEAFSRDPSLVWEWYGWRRAKVHAARPNAAHRALVDLAASFPGRCATGSTADLVSCGEQVGKCRFCESLRRSAGLPLACDAFDDGSENESCP